MMIGVAHSLVAEDEYKGYYIPKGMSPPTFVSQALTAHRYNCSRQYLVFMACVIYECI